MKQDNSIGTIEVKKEYYKSGALRFETPYKNGMRHGIRKWYYESGAPYLEIPYVRGKEHGIEKLYHESGALYSETPYVDGKKHGIEKDYDKDKTNIYRLTLYKENWRIASIKI